MFQLLKIWLLFMLGSFPNILLAANCNEDHCSKVSMDLNDACKAAGYAGGAPFPVVRDNQSLCFCPCSCVVAGTKISMYDGSTKNVEDLALKSQVFAPYLDEGAAVGWRLKSNVNEIGIYDLSFSSGTKLSVSPNHTFITPSEQVTDAKTLLPGDEILDENDGVVTVISKNSRLFSGQLYNFAIRLDSQAAADHIIVNSGVQSGDWALQSANDRIESDIYLRMNPIESWEEK